MASDFDIQEGLVDLENGEVYIGGVALDVEDKPGIARALDGKYDAWGEVTKRVMNALSLLLLLSLTYPYSTLPYSTLSYR
jgi:hypothetical protein